MLVYYSYETHQGKRCTEKALDRTRKSNGESRWCHHSCCWLSFSGARTSHLPLRHRTPHRHSRFEGGCIYDIFVIIAWRGRHTCRANQASQDVYNLQSRIAYDKPRNSHTVIHQDPNAKVSKKHSGVRGMHTLRSQLRHLDPNKTTSQKQQWISHTTLHLFL